jgi:hypothetical protein
MALASPDLQHFGTSRSYNDKGGPFNGTSRRCRLAFEVAPETSHTEAASSLRKPWRATVELNPRPSRDRRGGLKGHAAEPGHPQVC